MADGLRWWCLAIIAWPLLNGCSTEVGSSGGDGNCVSSYDPVASAPSWPRLKDALLRYDERGRVEAVRVQAAGGNIDSPGDKDVVRVIDLVNQNGRRLAQLDVWRTEAEAWRAGIWSQCID